MPAALPEGQDWANYQVAQPSTTGLAFAIVKATEGTGYTNPKHTAQVAHARAHSLVVGHYHFARPGSMTAQADYFLAHAAARAGEVLAFDWEDTGVSGAQKDAWLRYVQGKAPHNRVILYCNRDYWLHRDTTGYQADGLWIADPSAPKGAPRISAPWLFHQYGSPGGLDRNVSSLSADALRTWAAGATPITPQQEEDMAGWNDRLTLKKGSWTKADVTAPASDVIWLANVKAQVAAEQAKAANVGVKALTAQIAGLTAAVTALANHGGLTAAEITAAAKAGADAALAELGDALTKEN